MEDMFITPIQPWDRIGAVGSVGSVTGTGSAASASKSVKGQEGVSAFKSISRKQSTRKRDGPELAKNQYLLATGQIEDPHTVGIAASHAQLSVDLLAALRTKALEAYNEIMRLSS